MTDPESAQAGTVVKNWIVDIPRNISKHHSRQKCGAYISAVDAAVEDINAAATCHHIVYFLSIPVIQQPLIHSVQQDLQFTQAPEQNVSYS